MLGSRGRGRGSYGSLWSAVFGAAIERSVADMARNILSLNDTERRLSRAGGLDIFKGIRSGFPLVECDGESRHVGGWPEDLVVRE